VKVKMMLGGQPKALSMGGFLIGMLLGIVGGATGFALTPIQPAGGHRVTESTPPGRRWLFFGRR
jgi:hypothetical protein